MPGLQPQRRTKLPRSRVDLRDIARYAFAKIMRAENVGRGGVWPRRNPTDLEANMIARCRNMYYDDGELRTWPGDAAKGTTFGTTHVMGFFNMLTEQAVNDNVFLTTLDAYRWNDGASDWEAVYEFYNKSTVDQIQLNVPAAGKTRVTGDPGTDWQSRDATTGIDISVGDEFKLTADPDTSYLPIEAVNSDTQIDLTGLYAGGAIGPGAAAAYTIRKHFTGTTEQFFAMTEFQEKMYFSNGVNPLKEWDPATPADRLNSVVEGGSGPQPTWVPAARVLETFARRIFAAKLANYGRTAETLQTIAWCAEADQTDWSDTGSGFRNFIETPGAVQQLKRMDENLVLYKEFDIWWGAETLRAEPPVAWQPKVTSPRQGLLAYRSVVPIAGAGHLYLGQDNFYLLSPFKSQPVGAPVRDFLFDNLDRQLLARVQGELLDEFQMVAWLLPLGATGAGKPRILLYDYVGDAWYGPLELGVTREVHSIGHFRDPSGEATTIDQLVGTIDEQTFRLGQAIVGAGARSVLLGDTSGQVNEVDEQLDAYNGENRSPVFRTGQVYLGEEPHYEASPVRVTLVYRQPEFTPAPQVVVDLSDDDFRTVLASDTQNLSNASPGATSKAFFDFPAIAAERIAAEVSVGSTASQFEVLELMVEATQGGVERSIS